MVDQTQAELVIERFGSRLRLCEAIEEPEQKVRNWQRGGSIPQKYHFDILVAARRLGVQLMPHDLVAYLITQLLAAAEAGDSTTPGTEPAVAADAAQTEGT